MKRLRHLLLALLALLTFGGAGAAERFVYHVSDAANVPLALANARNHVKARPQAHIVVVALSGGVDFLLDGARSPNGGLYQQTVQDLIASGKVEFRVCNNTLEARRIDKSRVVPEATVVPSGVGEIGRLQAEEGYGYIKP